VAELDAAAFAYTAPSEERSSTGRRPTEELVDLAAANGQKIAYEDSGGAGPVVVLAHGFLMDRTMFAPQVAALRDSYRVITWDARGFGDTVFDGLPFTYWDLAHDCLALLDHLGIERAVVGGTSQGGFVALRLAMLAPERVEALLLFDSQAGTEDPALVPAMQATLDDWAANGPSSELADVIGDLLLGDANLKRTWIPRWMARDPATIAEPSRTLLTRDDVAGRLGTIDAPALVLHGTSDAAVGMDRAQALADGLPGCRGVVAIPEGSHAANLTHPGAVNDALVTFLASLPR
jgi:3-oxoadipate enol-lactonase